MTHPNGDEMLQFAHAELTEMMRGYEKLQLFYVAAKLRIADLLQDKKKDVKTLAGSTGIEPQILYRLMRGLAWSGLVIHEENDQFSLTPLGAALRTGVPHSLRDGILLIAEIQVPAWSGLLHAVQTGESGFEHAYGMKLFEYLAKDAEARNRFHSLMGRETYSIAFAIANAYDLSKIERIVDVGGGNGTLLVFLLHANPHMEGVIFDLPSVAEEAAKQRETRELADRCKVIAGDFFVDIPRDGDAYIMKWILHDWDDGHCLRILKNCRRVMAKSGRLLVVERVIPEGIDAPTEVIEWDLGMLVHVGGRERTETEFRRLFSEADFDLTQIIPIASGLSIIEGNPV